MVNLYRKFNGKEGMQRFVLVAISIAVLLILSVGIFFLVKSGMSVEQKDSDALKNNNNVISNTKDSDDSNKNDEVSNSNKEEKSENKDDATSVNSDDKSNTTNSNGVTDNGYVANVNNSNNVSTKLENDTSNDEVYFQKFEEEYTTNKEWETLDVSWKPVEVDGNLVPTGLNTLKPVISLTKSLSKDGMLKTGDEVTYTIVAKNTGNTNANNLVLSDKIDTMYFEILDLDGASKKEDGTLEWTIPSIDVNNSFTVSIKLKVKDVDDDIVVSSEDLTVKNIAYITGDNIKDEKSNETQNEYVKPVLSYSKVSIVNGDLNGTNTIKNGDIITYVITVTNSGNYMAENVIVKDSLPEGTELVSGEIEKTFDIIEAKETKKLEFSVKVVNANESIKNIAYVNDNSTNETVNPSLDISKTSEVEFTSRILTNRFRAQNVVTTGSVIKYSINVKNKSKDTDAKNVVVSDMVPTGTKLYVDATHKVSDNAVVRDDKITWNVDVSKNSSKTVSFYVIVLENEDSTVIKNTAYVNDEPTSTDNLYVKPIISGNKESFIMRNDELVKVTSLLPGDRVIYKITLTNSGSLNKFVSVEDILPDTLENISILSNDQNASVEGNKITWQVDVPAKNANGNGIVVLEYSAAVKQNATGTIKNGVVTSDDTEITPTADPVITAQKLSLVNGNESSVVTTGDEILYQIEVTNTSLDVDATDIIVKDIVPDGTKLIPDSISGVDTFTVTDKEILWNISNIEKNSKVVVSFKVSVTKNEIMTDGEKTIIKNTAYVNDKETNTDKKEYERANFIVNKVANRSIVKIGDKITYTITVTNNGTKSGSNNVIDLIPVQGVTLSENTIVASKGEALFTSPNLNWNVELEVGESATLTYSVTVISNGSIKNTVTTPDDTKTTETSVVKITKTGVDSVKPGGIVTYKILAENTSDVDLDNITVSDSIETTMAVFDNLDLATSGYSINENTISWKNQTISANSSKEYTFSVRVKDNVGLGRNIINVAYVNDVPSNEVVTTVKDYIITATKSVDKEAAKIGDILTYKITLRNNGNLEGITSISDILDENLQYDSNYEINVQNGGNNYTASYDDATHKIIVENVTVSPDAETVITFSASVNATTSSAIKNTAVITTDETETTTNEVSTLLISKSVTDENGNDINGALVKQDDVLTYVITVNNLKNTLTKNVEIKDNIPDGTEFVSASNGVIPNENNELVWNLEVLQNTSSSVEFKVKVKENENTKKISNKALVNGVFTNEVENTFVKPIISINKSSSINVNDSIDGKVIRGGKITYTITVKNDGGLQKENVEISDFIPDNTTFVMADDDVLLNTVEITVDGNKVSKEQLSWKNLVVPAYGSISKSFTVKVNETTTADNITNTATVDGNNTNTTDDKVYYEDKFVRFTKKTDTIIDKNIVMVLDVSYSMNKKELPAQIDYNSPCSGPSILDHDYCEYGWYYDHVRVGRRYYHYKTKLQAAKETMIAFLEKMYSDPKNADTTVDIITYAEDVENNVTVSKNNYKTVINGFTTHPSTNIYAALKATKEKIKSYTNNNSNMVIFIGDGEPTDGKYTDPTNLGNYAKTIYNKKKTDTTIYSIGMAISEGSKGEKVLSAIATSGKADLTKNTTDLINAFNKISIESSHVHCDESTENGVLKDHTVITDGGANISQVDGSKVIIVKYGTEENEKFTFAPTATQTSIQVLNSENSQNLLATQGLKVTYNETTNKFTVDLKDYTRPSPESKPTVQIIYY